MAKCEYQSLRSKILLKRKAKKLNKYFDNSIELIAHECVMLFVITLISFLIALFFDRVMLPQIYQISALIRDGENNITRYLAAVVKFSWPRIYFFFIWIFLISYMFYWGKLIVYRFRYIFALVLLILLVVGKFTGSSLGFYDGMITDNTEDYTDSTLLGIPQGLRGDEWATEKPYYFAQETTDYSYFNNNLMLDGCDMVISAFAPVKDIVILSRPDLWGFLFLPRDYAFSFYWNLRIILLFLASFEMGFMLTKSKKYGVFWALFVCFAPPIQWWLSQVTMIVVWSGEYFVVAFNQLLQSKKWILKLIYTLVCALLGIIYILTMYPASQVTMGYIFAIIIIYLLYKNNKSICKQNLICLGGVVSLIGSFIVYFYHMSGPAMNQMLQTTYPGSTRSWQELPWDYEFLKFINPITWIKSLVTINNCEASQYVTFLPFLIVALCYYIYKIKKEEKSDHILFGLLFVACLFMWMIAYAPQCTWLNKITLLSFAYPVRILFTTGFGFMLILFLLLYKNEKKKKVFPRGIGIFISSVLFVIIYSYSLKSELLKEYLPEDIRSFIIFFAVLIYSFMGYCLIRGGVKATRVFVILYICISFFSTAFINPVTYGTDSMFEKVSLKKIQEINEKNPGRWMVSGNTTISNLVTAQGVARVSGTYYYPDDNMMKIIDPECKYKDLWNQYAHIDMRLTAGHNMISQYDYEQDYKLNGVDRIIYVNLETAKKLGIKYIFTRLKIPSKYLDSNELIKTFTNNTDGWEIYTLQ